MALTYNGTDVRAVKDKPAGYVQGAIPEVLTPDYNKSYEVVIDKSLVDTTADEVINFTALVAAVDAAMPTFLADFDIAGKTVIATGKVSSFTLSGGSKYLNSVNTSSYVCQVETKISVA